MPSEPIGSLSSLVWGSPNWFWAVLGTLLAFLSLLLVIALRSPVPRRWQLGLFALKALALSLLAFCLLDPLIARQHAKPGENIVVLLADRSASMTIRESPGSPASRGDGVKALLSDPESAWRTRLSQDFDVRHYTFGESIARVEGFQDLQFDAPGSNLGGALAMLARRFQRQPLAAIFLFTDGNSTDPIPSELASGVPVFPVWNETQQPIADLAISQVSVSQSNFEDAPVSVVARIAAAGKPPGQVLVTLEPELAPEETADEFQRKSEQLTLGDRLEATARFLVKPSRPGVLFYRLRAVDSEAPAAASESGRDEATLINNERLLVVNRDAHVSRILYLAGRPNWEHKFLGRALADDDLLQLVSLVRIAKKEAKFDFRGRVGESSNALFRGFKDRPDEETEAYDQPVLVRLNTRDEKELSDGFPKTKAALYEFDAVILDDVEAAFLSHDQQALLDQFVSERGGGLLMLGGRDSYRHGHWEQTPVADALPVYLHRPEERIDEKFAWRLTRDGWLEPWMRIRETEQAEQRRLAAAPPLTMRNGVQDIKPGARVLAEVETESGQLYPALVVQQYGRGRAGALLVGDLWRWSLQAQDVQEDDPGKSWRQIVRWLVGDVPKRLEVAVEPVYREVTGAVSIQARVRDRNFDPQDGIRVEILVRQPDGSEVSLDVQPSLKEPGLFEALHVSRMPGGYVARVRVPGEGDQPPRQTEIGWTSDPAAAEFESTSVNKALLDRLAEQTGGRVVSRSQLEEFVAGLPYRELPSMEVETTPLWHRTWMLLAVIGLLGLEWGLRRWRGLA